MNQELLNTKNKDRLNKLMHLLCHGRFHDFKQLCSNWVRDGGVFGGPEQKVCIDMLFASANYIQFPYWFNANSKPILLDVQPEFLKEELCVHQEFGQIDKKSFSELANSLDYTYCEPGQVYENNDYYATACINFFKVSLIKNSQYNEKENERALAEFNERTQLWEGYKKEYDLRFNLLKKILDSYSPQNEEEKSDPKSFNERMQNILRWKV